MPPKRKRGRPPKEGTNGGTKKRGRRPLKESSSTGIIPPAPKQRYPNGTVISKVFYEEQQGDDGIMSISRPYDGILESFQYCKDRQEWMYLVYYPEDGDREHMTTQQVAHHLQEWKLRQRNAPQQQDDEESPPYHDPLPVDDSFGLQSATLVADSNGTAPQRGKGVGGGKGASSFGGKEAAMLEKSTTPASRSTYSNGNGNASSNGSPANTNGGSPKLQHVLFKGPPAPSPKEEWPSPPDNHWTSPQPSSSSSSSSSSSQEE